MARNRIIATVDPKLSEQQSHRNFSHEKLVQQAIRLGQSNPGESQLAKRIQEEFRRIR